MATELSTFERARASISPPQPDADSAIANVYAAYSAGRMASEQAAAFEADVKAGKVLLPAGATLRGAATPEVSEASQRIFQAYSTGRMTDEQRAAYERDVRAGAVPLPVGASLIEVPGFFDRLKEMATGEARQTRATQELPSMYEAGLMTVFDGTDVSAANQARLAAVLLTVTDPAEAAKILQAASPDMAVAQDEKGNLIVANNKTGRQFPINPPGFDRTDAAQTAALATAFTPAGAGRGILATGARSAATQAAIETGQAASGGDFNAEEVALAGGIGAAGAGLVQAAPAVSQALRRVGGEVAATGRSAVQRVLGRAEGAVPGAAQPAAARGVQTATAVVDAATPTPGTLGSVGGAGTDMAVQRRAAAEALPEPIQLTEGQATRDAAQLRFEIETAKDPAQGARLRERGETQNAAILKNFDSFVDDVGAKAPDIETTGRTVVDALTTRAAKDKAAIRTAYKEAERAGEMRAPVAADPVVEALNAAASAESVAPVLKAAKAELQRLGGAVADDTGALVARDMSLSDMELLRRFVNKTAGADPTNIKFAGDIKRAIDAATEGAGGDMYKKARGLRAKFAETYEDRAVVADLLNTKRGMADRKVAVDKVFERSVLGGSPDDLRFLRSTLTADEEGAQAWRELQGATINYLREQATRNVTTNQRGDRVISAAGLDRAVDRLDKNGRLDLVLGKQRAQMVRDLNDIAKYVQTAPPGVVNTSNTASVVLAALAEAGTLGSLTGLPLPVLSGLRLLSRGMKDRAVATRVSQALGEAEKKAAKTDTARLVRERATLRAIEQENAAPKPPRKF